MVGSGRHLPDGKQLNLLVPMKAVSQMNRSCLMSLAARAYVELGPSLNWCLPFGCL